MDIPTFHITSKPQYVSIAEDVDFLRLFDVVNSRFDICYLLESLGQGGISRYSVIGFDPEHIVHAQGNDFLIDDVVYDFGNPYTALRKVTPQTSILRRYAGGLFGYMSYESFTYIEPSVSVKMHGLFDQFMFGVYTDGLVLDTMTNELFYFYHNTDRSSLVKDMLRDDPKPGNLSVRFTGDRMSREDHAHAVEKTKRKIAQGYTFQCEVGFKSEYEIVGDTFQIYKRLREVNPSPYMYYVKFGSKKIIGASPELLLKLTDGEIETHPLAGTARRGSTHEDDRALARALLNDPKEIAEHNMLVDLHRNDIGRVSRIGTVKVRRLKEIRAFSHVQHICSEIAGVIKSEYDMFDALAALFPGGALSGAPKIETIKIIDAQEKDARGPYGGAVGYFGFNGDCIFAIPIRTLFMSGTYAYTQTCSGIVADSEAHKEYAEIQHKVEAMKRTLSVFMV